LAECRDVTLFHTRVEPRAVMHRAPCRFCPTPVIHGRA
jgi:hypothetical protein